MFHVLRMLTDAAYVRPSEWREQATLVESNRKYIALQAFSLIIIRLVQTCPPFLVQNCKSLRLQRYAGPLSQFKERQEALTTPAEPSPRRNYKMSSRRWLLGEKSNDVWMGLALRSR